MDLAGTEQAGACGWALNEGFKSGTISLGEVGLSGPGEGNTRCRETCIETLKEAPSRR